MLLVNRVRRCLTLFRPRARTVVAQQPPKVLAERVAASFTVAYPSVRYALLNMRMPYGVRSQPRMAFAGKATAASDGVRLVVVPILNGRSENALWFQTVRPVLRATITASADGASSVIRARIAMNRVGLLWFRGAASLGALGAVALVAGLVFEVTALLLTGLGFLVWGAFVCAIFLANASDDTVAGFAALDAWLTDQTQGLPQ